MTPRASEGILDRIETELGLLEAKQRYEKWTDGRNRNTEKKSQTQKQRARSEEHMNTQSSSQSWGLLNHCFSQ